MKRDIYPFVTTTENVSAFDLNNRFRIPLWVSEPSSIMWDQRENDALLLTLLEFVEKTGQVWTNPIIRWQEDTRLDGWTTLSKAMGAADTYIAVADPYVMRAWNGLSFPLTGENVIVVDVDEDNSEGWTNDAGDACNVKLDRTSLGSPKVAAALGSYVYILPAFMGELSEPRQGTTTTPGEPVYNFITLISKSFSMSKYQLGSKMVEDFGTLPKEIQNQVFKIRQEQQYGLLFQNRATWNDADEGQVYIGQGAVHYIKSNVLDLGTLGNRMTWENLNDFLDPTFDPAESSDSKVLLAGPNLYADGLRMMREMNRLDDGMPYFEPTMKAWTFNIRTDMGRTVTVYLDKFALGAGLSRWGFLLDLKNMGGGEYEGLGPQWIQNIQSNRSVLLREDAYLMSYALNLYHEKCHGVIRGGTSAIVQR